MSEQDLFAAETAAEVREVAAHFDALHHTPEEEVPGSLAATGGPSSSGSSGSGKLTGAAASAGAAQAAARQPPATGTPTRAEGPAAPGSPLDPGVGPVSGSTAQGLRLHSPVEVGQSKHPLASSLTVHPLAHCYSSLAAWLTGCQAFTDQEPGARRASQAGH